MAGHRGWSSGDWSGRGWGGQPGGTGHLKQWEWILGAECRQKEAEEREVGEGRLRKGRGRGPSTGDTAEAARMEGGDQGGR